MAADWYYAQDGQQVGPVAWKDLVAVARSAKLQPTDLVWQTGMPNWVAAETIPGLFEAPARPSARARPQREEAPQEDYSPQRFARDVRRRDRDEDEDDPPRRNRAEREFDDDYPRSRHRRERPGVISAIAGMMLGGGIYSLVFTLGFGGLMGLSSLGICCLWPGWYYGIVWGILAIIRATAMLGENDRQGPPQALAIMQIILIINLDFINLALGIVSLVLMNGVEAQTYFNQGRRHED